VEVKQRVTLHFRRQPATLGGVGFVARQKPVKSIWAVRLDNRQPKRKKCGKKKKVKEDLVANRQSGKVEIYFCFVFFWSCVRERIYCTCCVCVCEDDGESVVAG
jgi:hypothetical protein